jgi:histidinol dehydrogenase
MTQIISSGNANVFLDKISSRARGIPQAEDTVKEIIEAVKKEGDAALNRYSRKFDNTEVYEIKKEEIKKAYDSSDAAYIKALKSAADNIYEYHIRQKYDGYRIEKEGIILGCRVTPIERVGLYVPGGSAAYPSSVLMNAIPAKIAGVKEVIMITPPSKNGKPNPDILAAAYICNVDRIFIAGGAQGIAALAYGTDTVPKVDKIVGPGNIYVATAKKMLFGTVDIDMIAGPSEILVIADQTANPEHIAADMLSQAEHDELSSAILLTISESLAEKVNSQLKLQLSSLNRKAVAEKSLNNYGAIIVCRTIEECAKLSNIIAPEHLEIMTEKPFEVMDKITNAGSIFLGSYSPEPLGDYYSGTNHVLPTNGTARFFSSLGVYSFVKKSAYTYYDKNALFSCSNDIITIAEKEGLSAHANSIKIRFKD